MHTSIVRHVDPNAFASFELIVIAACVLGGANVFGGEGTVLGTFLGVFLLAVIENGLIMAKVPSYGHQVLVGAVILIAVSLDVSKIKRQEREYATIDVSGECASPKGVSR
jgi:simple sugar transport system permease protein